MRALVVEDDRLARALVVEVLRRRGHDVWAFADAETAWEACQQEAFPLVILDWVLPGMDGLELCQRIRTLPHGDSSLVLVLTARERPEDLTAVLNAGADDYVPKSVAGGLLAIRLAIAERRVEQIAARKRAEAIAARAQAAEAELAALGELNRQQKLLLNLISHELHTPLAAILGFSELLLDPATGPEQQQRGLRAIHEGALRLCDLVSEVIELTWLQAHDCHLDRQPLDLARALPSWLSDLAAPPRIVVSVAPDLPPIEGDDARLRKVVRHLVENALKFSPRETTVEVEAHRAGEMVVVRVRDRGPGIPPDEQARVFEPFYRTAGAHEQAARGRGLGLALVRRIAELHGGQIGVESAVGEGSTFTIALPIAPSRPA
ncbi:MAG: response regulator [Chloroflexi bacterium]|nr:response regulator [Chloroflexota bacterium]